MASLASGMAVLIGAECRCGVHDVLLALCSIRQRGVWTPIFVTSELTTSERCRYLKLSLGHGKL